MTTGWPRRAHLSSGRPTAMTSRNPCINSTLPKECNITSYLLKGWNRDKQDICIVVDAEDDLTRGINGHEVARAAEGPDHVPHGDRSHRVHRHPDRARLLHEPGQSCRLQAHP